MFLICGNDCMNDGEIESCSEKVLNIKLSINKYKWKGKNYSFKIDDWKTFETIISQLLLILCILKEKKYIQLISKN